LTSSRTLPAGPTPPDQARRLAAAAPARRNPPSGHHPAADPRPTATREDRPPTPSPRAPATTALSKNEPYILTPVRCRGRGARRCVKRKAPGGAYAAGVHREHFFPARCQRTRVVGMRVTQHPCTLFGPVERVDWLCRVGLPRATDSTLRLERLLRSRASARSAATEVQWEVAPSSACTGVDERRGSARLSNRRTEP
jgi:hypothetical protein